MAKLTVVTPSIIEDEPLANVDPALTIEDDAPSLTNEEVTNGPSNLKGNAVEALVTGQDTFMDEDESANDETTQPITLTDAYAKDVDTPAQYVESRAGAMVPLEIHFHIIESFRDDDRDNGSIANCALVCRAWLPICRRKLYSSLIRLSSRSHWMAFRNSVLHPKSSSMMQCREMVRDLTVYGDDDVLKNDFSRVKDVTPQPKLAMRKNRWINVLLVEGAMRLTGLIRLTIYDFNLGHLHPMALECGQRYQSLTDLGIVGCAFSNILQLHQFVTVFPALRYLELYVPTFHSTAVTPHLSRVGHPLRSLEVRTRNSIMPTLSAYFSTQLHLVQDLYKFHWFSDYNPAQTDDEAFTALIKGIKGTHLEELTLSMFTPWQGACVDHFSQVLYLVQFDRYTSPEVDFSRFKTLKRIVIGSRSSMDLQEQLAFLMCIFDTISSPELWWVRMALIIQSNASLDLVLEQLTALGNLDTTLARPSFSKLHEVFFHCYTPDYRTISGTPRRSTATETGPSPDQSSETPSGDVSTYKQTIEEDPELAADFIERKIRDELKQLDTRGILKLGV